MDSNIMINMQAGIGLQAYKPCNDNEVSNEGQTLCKHPTAVLQIAESFVKQSGFFITSTLDASNSADAPFLEGDDLNLEEFVDVVTTYKCKFCEFSCAWKAELMSHIKNTHIKKQSLNECSVRADENFSLLGSLIPPKEHDQNYTLNSAVDNKIYTFTNKNEDKEIIEGQVNNEGTVQENHTFLCGQCHQAFNGFDACKEHVILEHQVSLEQSVPPAPKIKRKPKKKKQHYEVEYSPKAKKDKVIVMKDCTETLSKRKVRPPRALSEDYYLLSRKRKYIRRQDPQEKQFRCYFGSCGQHFATEVNLNIHTRCHTSEDQSFQCHECQEKCEHWRVMTMHLWKVHQIDLDLFACNDCSYRSYSPFKLENHRRIHSAERNFKCNVCDKGFKQINQLRNHKVIHLDRKNMTERRWFMEQKCSTCNRSFSDTKCLRKHMQTVHNKLKPFVCSFCGHTSARKAMLQLHLRQHTGEKPFKCELCDYRTGDHNSLRRHKMRHSGVKPYKCQHCPYACIQAISYKTHMKNKHPGMEGLYCCQLCSFRSVSNENYTNHMSDHKRGVLPLKNESCSSNTPPNENIEIQLAPPAVETITNLEQLQSILPGSSDTTQLIYSCLNALSANGNGLLPPGVTATNQGNTQTITIQIPNERNGDEREHIYLTINQPVALSTDINAYPNAGMVDNDEIIDYISTEMVCKDGNATSLEKVTSLSRDMYTTISENGLVNVCSSLNSSCLPVLRTLS